MRDHPIFEQFDFMVPRTEGDFHVNNVGCRTRREFEQPLLLRGFPEMLSSGAALDRREGDLSLPDSATEDYYEWIDLLTAIAEAKDHFIMVEVGAGYGRWIANAAHALDRFRGQRISSRFFCGVEMQDKQFTWMQQHLDMNGVSAPERLLVHGGVSDADAFELMPVREDINYGAGMLKLHNDVVKGYFDQGMTHIRLQDSDDLYKIIRVITLTDLLRQVVGQGGIVDIMHVDIQGAEFRTIPSAIEALSRQVKRLHIGTHGREIEAELSNVLLRHGWSIDRHYPCFSQTAGEFGPITMLDGIMSCRNSRFFPG